MPDFTDFRKDKILIDTTHFMQKILNEVETEVEFIQVLEVWGQVLGATIGSLDEPDEDGFKMLRRLIVSSITKGYIAKTR